MEVLPAGYGDCILITCPIGSGRSLPDWRMLIDTGPDECWPSLKKRLAAIPPSDDGTRFIDVFVVSHIDHDHIGGARLLLEDRDLHIKFGDIWFNAPMLKVEAGRVGGVAEGHTLSKLLGASAGRRLPWNLAFGGDHAVTPATGRPHAVPTARGHPRITLLSPDPSRLASLFKVWARELERLHKKEHNERVEPPRVGRAGLLDLAALAVKTTAVDRAAPNGSSIAFLLEHRGASILLAADAFPQVLASALESLAAERRTQGQGAPGTSVHSPLKLDVFKLSHHGSRANTTLDLLDAVRADHYVVSTNGAIFGHPNDEALARVIMRGGKGSTLWFNHASGDFGERLKRWTDPDMKEKYGYQVATPARDLDGITLRIAPASPQSEQGRPAPRSTKLPRR